MLSFKRLFDFYLQASIHVALAVFALVLMTQHQFNLGYQFDVALFAFFGTIVGYNFVKYDALTRHGKTEVGPKIKTIAVFSLLCFVGAVWAFLKLRMMTQFVSIGVLLLTMLYTLPFFPNRKNARNWAGVKIYIVALCWVGVTLLLPLIDAGVPLSVDVLWKSLQRFIFVFVLVLIFEIIDLSNDDPHLQTVPQQIGERRTKILGLILLAVFYLLEFLQSNFDSVQLIINSIIVVMISLFLVFANPNRSKYYSSFWVESLPAVWLLLLLVETCGST